MAEDFIFDSDDLITFCAEFDNVSLDDLSDTLLEVTLQDLNDRWANLQKSYRSLRTSDEVASEKGLVEAAKGKHSACTQSYHKCKAKILDLQRTFSANTPVNELPVSCNEEKVSYVNVPPCDTDIFYGGYEDWPSFRDMFTAVYIDNPRIPPVQKLYHLRLKVQGQAGAIIRKYKLCSDNFALAWEALRDRYENQRILVENQIKILLNLPPIPSENSKALQNLQSAINDCLAAIAAQDVLIDQWDPFIIMLCSSKLPLETLSLWEQSLESHRKLVKWERMDNFLSHRCEVVERLESRHNNFHSEAQKKEIKTKLNASKSESVSYSCKFCGSNHSLKSCAQFLELEPRARNQFVLSNKICVNCLAYSHLRKECPSRFACAQCKKNHHSLLHFTQPVRSNEKSNYLDEKPETSARGRARDALPANAHIAHAENRFQAENTLLPTAIVQIRHRGENFKARAFLDQGSEKTFISKRLQQQLMLPTETKFFQIHGIGGQVVGESNSLCELTLYSHEYRRRVSLKAIVVPKITRMLPSFSFDKSEIPLTGLEDIELADPGFHSQGHVDLLIGSNVLPQVLLEGVKNISPYLIAQSTIFGWVISGSINVEHVSAFVIEATETANNPLNEQLRKFWELEEIPNNRPVSIEDEYCERLFEETTFRNAEGRYVVKLPFKLDFSRNLYLGSSRRSALAQYLQLESSMKKKGDLAKTYSNVLQEYLLLNHMKPTSSAENESDYGYNSFYLPHHAVVRPESRSTKLRVVFNASKKTSSGLSLNDVLHVGPTLQADLMTLILNWRLYEYVFNGDIEKMYRQILISDADSQFQRILFRPDPQLPIQDFCLKTVTFGVNCAPYLAIRTLIQLARDSEKQYPQAAYILTKETYVDDILSGSHDKAAAMNALSQVIAVLKSAGFPLKKITSNSPEILASVPKTNILDEDFLKFKESSATKTLGIQWNALYDFFSYTIEPMSTTNAITKRQILSSIAKLFDPAGWISPIIIQAKMILQQLWLDGTGWDENIKPSTLVVWNKFVENIPIIGAFKIPRWNEFSPSRVTQLHGFCDASEKAYCAAIYFRIQTGTAIVSHLFVSKTKVAPIDPISLPRLELCGAVLLAKLVKQITNSLSHKKFDLFLWTDSSIVLGWLAKPPNVWKTYVANRTAQIIRNVGNISWRHVKSSENPADLGSRGCNADQLINNSLWWNGPDWLRKSPEEWPKPISINENSLELKRKVEVFHLVINTECKTKADEANINEDILKRFSKWDRCIRVMVYVFRFIDTCKKRRQTQSKTPLPRVSQTPQLHLAEAVSTTIQLCPSISYREFEKTKYRLLSLTQLMHYKEEYDSLLMHSKVDKKSSLFSLNPYIDGNQVIRINGRLANSAIPYNERHPIILPANSTFCTLYISFTHNLLMHAEINLMLRAIRSEYFVPRLKSAIRFFIRKCIPCVRYKQKIKSQLMGALPLERSTFSLPFTITDVDFAGPFSIKTAITRSSPYHKGYVCVFVCFSTKAMHLELCSNLSAGAFRAAFTRFIGRRGLPKRVLSDNGTNFVGAERLLRHEYQEFLKCVSADINQKYTSHGFHWSFIPPNAPHMGGLWEAGVKSFKMHFKKVAQNHKYTFEEFTTLLARIESVLNSRPLSPMSEDPDELLALTPGHFLRGSPIIACPEVPNESLTLRDRWEKLKILHHQFAQRWKDEYLKELQKRYKWQTSEENLAIGQLVVIKDDLLPPNEWRLARITKLYFGSDGLVRVADLKTQIGATTRPISKLCPLPIRALDSD